MAFIHIHMLLGLLAVSIPVILHILNRRSAKKTLWGAMRFLKDSLMQRQRKILLEEILLMCLRCLLFLILALIAARPYLSAGARVSRLVVLPTLLLGTCVLAAAAVLTAGDLRRWRRRLLWAGVLCYVAGGTVLLFEERIQARFLQTGGARDMALILDASDSMLMEVNGVRNFDRAVDEARELVTNAPPGSAFSLVVGGSIPHALISTPSVSREDVLNRLETLQAGKGLMRTPGTLSLAAYTLARGSHPAKQAVLFSDGQREGWDLTGGAADWRAVGRSFTQLPGNTPVIFRRYELPEGLRNLAISSVDFSRAVIGTDRPVTIRVGVVNHGEEAVTPEGVRLTIGEDVYFEEGLGQLPPGAERTVSFSHHFQDTGPAVIEAEVTVEDNLPADNKAWRVINPTDELWVLIVDESGPEQFIERDGALAALALAPVQQGRRSRVDDPEDRPTAMLFRPRLRHAGELEDEDLTDYAVVVLANVSSLPDAAAGALARFVRAGGGLLIAHGDASDPEFYNQWQSAGTALLPASLTEQRGGENIGLDMERIHDPALSLFRSEPMDLPSALFQSPWLLSPRQNAAETAVFTDGTPLLARGRFGEGSIFQLAAGIASGDGNLTSSRAFVPLMHEIVLHLARQSGSELDDFARPGSAFPLASLAPYRERSRALEWLRGQSSERFSVNGSPASGARLRDGYFHPPPQLGPGLHHLELPTGAAEAFPGLPDSGEIPFALRREGNEGRPGVIGESESVLLRRHLLWQEAADRDSLYRMMDGQRSGREVWRGLALFALALLLLETAACRWIAVRRKMGEEMQVDFRERGGPGKEFQEQLTRLKSSKSV